MKLLLITVFLVFMISISKTVYDKKIINHIFPLCRNFRFNPKDTKAIIMIIFKKLNKD